MPADPTFVPDSDNIQSRLRIAIGGMTYAQVATMTGVSKESVRRYMRGDSPSYEFLVSICRGFGLSADWLLLGDGAMRREGRKGSEAPVAEPTEPVGK